MGAIKLDAAYLRQMGIATVDGSPQQPQGTDERIDAISFSDTNRWFVTSSKSGSIALYDGQTGKREATYCCKDTGCRHVTFTHNDNAILHASGSQATGAAANGIHYHDILTNKFIRTFQGHGGKVTSVHMHPLTDLFLSTSLEGRFLLWDIRQHSPIGSGTFDMPPKQVLAQGAEVPYPVGAFDPTGKVFAIATPHRGLALYDPPSSLGITYQQPFFKSITAPMFKYTSRPFRMSTMPPAADVPPPYPELVSYTGMEFSPDGTVLAMNTSDRGVFLVHAKQPHKEYALLQTHPVDPTHPSSISFSPDGRWLTVGAVDGHVYCYDVLEGRPDLSAHTEDVPFAYRPGSAGGWEPACVLLGESHKSESARAAAVEAAAAYRKKRHDRMHEMRAKFAASQKVSVDTIGAPKAIPLQPPILAVTAEQQVSRHEAPVNAVRWHGKCAVLVSAARSVAVWTGPLQSVLAKS